MMALKHPDIAVWESISDISSTMCILSSKLVSYNMLLTQISSLIDNKYNDTFKFNVETSPENIKNYIIIWWNHFHKSMSNKTLRRWKRIIRCNDDNVHEKTGIWIDEYMKRWKETQIQYDQLIVSFTSIWNTYANNKMSLFSIKEKGDLII